MGCSQVTTLTMVRTILLALLLLVTRLSASAEDEVRPEAPSVPATLSLPELEQRLVISDEVAMALADLEAGAAQLAQQRTDQGVKLFAAGGTGYTVDTSLAGSAKRYTTYDLRAGLRYPLLGRAALEERGIAEAESAMREREHRLELARRQGLALLRRQYAVLWTAGEKMRRTRAFLAEEPRQIELLGKRQRAGYLLAADRLEMLTAFDLARRNQAQANGALDLARHTISRLTGMDGEFAVVIPSLPTPVLDMAQLKETAVEADPVVAALRERLRGLERQAELTRAAGPSANLDFFAASGNDDALSDPEYSVGMAIGVELPAGRLSEREDRAGRAAEARVVQVRHELALARDQVWLRIADALAQHRIVEADLQLAERRLRAAEEGVRERGLRTSLEGDTLEQLQQARNLLYQVEQDYLDAQHRDWNNRIALLELVPEATSPERAEPTADQSANRPEPATTIATPVDDAPPPGVNSLYVWQSDQLQAQAETEASFLSDLRAAGIDRLLFSLNREQIERLKEPDARKRFADWLQRTRRAGFRLELLLGEPLWLLPRHRVGLMDILITLADLPFTGLHLDIEPHQLTPEQARTVDLRQEWLATVGAAKNLSPWPVGVSVHPRYFKPGKDGWRDFAPALAEIGVSEVILMVYASNPERVRAVAAPIMEQAPGLRFAVAQSVEPELSPSESHFQVGRRRFAERMAMLRRLLPPANCTGLVIQDWSRWREMGP